MSTAVVNARNHHSTQPLSDIELPNYQKSKTFGKEKKMKPENVMLPCLDVLGVDHGIEVTGLASFGVISAVSSASISLLLPPSSIMSLRHYQARCFELLPILILILMFPVIQAGVNC